MPKPQRKPKRTRNHNCGASLSPYTALISSSRLFRASYTEFGFPGWSLGRYSQKSEGGLT